MGNAPTTQACCVEKYDKDTWTHFLNSHCVYHFKGSFIVSRQQELVVSSRGSSQQKAGWAKDSTTIAVERESMVATTDGLVDIVEIGAQEHRGKTLKLASLHSLSQFFYLSQLRCFLQYTFLLFPHDSWPFARSYCLHWLPLPCISHKSWKFYTLAWIREFETMF